MTEISLADFKAYLDAHLEHLDAGRDEIVVNRDSADAVVLVSCREWESMKETIFLLSDPANRVHLRASIADADRGDFEERELVRS
ncbi:type II toxin-antitoxin system prevent-host-death family antitoxin [Fulvimarina sp. 2208YS6-2-32]|uniref:Antitoxin n=1 Tax=Fulvimarina uroteuthidis TaxID=3098149 RepID=A0ABU5HX14_9HYPH|nr:type II toxin-antitoxin system prevent-host-death family antitoxin [Fulvimarina sp. 2208YS6-2-32]MDY8107674.1 type II toxin-antitoxin system prevent-host-death family antitoxin [Fulvimarina sp. 2208YS6-2-32]